MATPEVLQMLAAAVAAADERKAEDIRILQLDPSESGLSDYFLICNGTNDRQNVAITDAIEMKLKQEFGTLPNSVEGRREAEWVLMDYVDFIVHVFSPEKRAYYGLERLRKTATVISPDELVQLSIATSEPKPVADRSTRTAIKKRSMLSPAKRSPARRAPAKRTPAKQTGAKVKTEDESE